MFLILSRLFLDFPFRTFVTDRRLNMQKPNLKNIDLHSLFFFSKGGRYLKVGVALSDMKNGTRLFFQE